MNGKSPLMRAAKRKFAPPVFLTVFLLSLCLAAGCVKRAEAPSQTTAAKDPAAVETVPSAQTAEPFVFPRSDPGTDALFSASGAVSFELTLTPGGIEPRTGESSPDPYWTHSALFAVPNRVLRIGADPTLRVSLWRLDPDGGAVRTEAPDGAFLYAHKNARWAFAAERADGSAFTTGETAVLTVFLYDPDRTPEGENGLWTVSPEWGTAGSYFGAFSLGTDASVSAPLPLSDGGLGVRFGGDGPAATRQVRISAIRLTDDGVFPAEDPALGRLTDEGGLSAQSLYLPAAENTYAVLSPDRGTEPGLIVCTGGTAKIGERNRLAGLFCANTVPDPAGEQDPPRIVQYTSGNMETGQNMLGAVLPVSDVLRIRCDPRYELLAELWQTDGEGVLRKKKTLAGDLQPGAGTTRGVSLFEPPEGAEGFLLIAVRRVAEPVYTEETGAALRDPGMGVLRGYAEVSAGVAVDYAEGRVPEILSDPTLEMNLADIAAERVPIVYGGLYCTPQHPDVQYPYPDMTDATPVFYNGRFNSNTYLHQITPRTYLTAAANPNSRFYLFGDARGYGSTCVSFSLSLLGLAESYPLVQLWQEELLKFDRSPFSVQTDLETLLPGDLLLEINPVTHVGHLVTVRALVRVGGALRAVTIVESWPPFARQRTFYLTGAADASGSALRACLPSELASYVCRLRVRPQYVRSLRELFDMSPDVSVGTVMCDRGSDAVYCIGEKNAEFTVTDETAKKLTVCLNGKRVGRIQLKKATRRNGFRVVDFSGFLTAPGEYTVYTDRSDDVQEQFFVPEPVESFRVEREQGEGEKPGTVRIFAASRSRIDCVAVFYKREDDSAAAENDGAGDGSPAYEYCIYPAEAVRAAEPLSGEGRGELTVPDSAFGKRYAFTQIFYRTPYGTFRIGRGTDGLFQTAEYRPPQ